MADDSLAEADFKIFHFVFLGAGGDLEIEFLGFLVQEQQRAGFGPHDPGSGVKDEFKKLVQVMDGGDPAGDIL